MKYLGIVKRENETLALPDSFQEVTEPRSYEAILVGKDILLLSVPLDRERLKQIEELADRSIEDHRSTLEGLAK